MPDPLATPADVADIWRPLSTAEQSQATNLIVKASALLRAHAPFDVDARLALETTDPDRLDAEVVASVVAGIVKRVMVNPDSAVSATESVGPYSHSTTFAQRSGSADVMRGDLVVTRADIAMLKPAATTFPKPFTIRTSRHHRQPDPPVRTWPPLW